MNICLDLLQMVLMITEHYQQNKIFQSFTKTQMTYWSMNICLDLLQMVLMITEHYQQNKIFQSYTKTQMAPLKNNYVLKPENLPRNFIIRGTIFIKLYFFMKEQMLL